MGPTDPSGAPDVDRLTADVREPGTRIGFLIHDVSRMRRTLYDQEVKPLGLTRSQWWVLAQLTRQVMPDGMLQTELAKTLDVGKVTIGGLIDRLEGRGFVSRQADRHDRRAKRIVVTEAGRRVAKDMVRISTQINAAIFQGASPDEMRATEAFLKRLKETIRAELEERSRGSQPEAAPEPNEAPEIAGADLPTAAARPRARSAGKR